jgi:16S rRNA (adenine1518-N6/adenine1519-N6)-dimethyltransferase
MPRTPRPSRRASRRLGQNFLADPALSRWLVDRFDPRPGERIVEIGPGRGALTEPLAERGVRLLALEVDPELAAALAERFAGRADVAVREADALRVDWGALAAELGGPVRVIGNLPYSVGTAILRRLLASEAFIDVQVVLQQEVAERLLAVEGCRAYGPLSIVAALRTERERLRRLAPGSFRPRPKVTSTALRLRRRERPALAAAEIPALERWLHRGFAQRRKTLAGNLGPLREPVRGWLRERRLSEDARAEALAPETWLALARWLEGAGS